MGITGNLKPTENRENSHYKRSFGVKVEVSNRLATRVGALITVARWVRIGVGLAATTSTPTKGSHARGAMTSDGDSQPPVLVDYRVHAASHDTVSTTRELSILNPFLTAGRTTRAGRYVALAFGAVAAAVRCTATRRHVVLFDSFSLVVRWPPPGNPSNPQRASLRRCAALVTSVVCDNGFSFGGIHALIFEDSPKFLGALAWAAYFALTSMDVTRSVVGSSSNKD